MAKEAQKKVEEKAETAEKISFFKRVKIWFGTNWKWLTAIGGTGVLGFVIGLFTGKSGNSSSVEVDSELPPSTDDAIPTIEE
jgi:hypothetical protein